MSSLKKFKKDLSILRAAVKKEIFLDLKHPKLYKKIRKYYESQGLIDFTGNEYEDYEVLMDVLSEDL